MKVSEFLRYCAPRQRWGCAGHAMELGFKGPYAHYIHLVSATHYSCDEDDGWKPNMNPLRIYLAAAIAQSDGQ